MLSSGFRLSVSTQDIDNERVDVSSLNSQQGICWMIRIRR
jgi:hypothetical protein